jgi:hypothetical protein
LDRRRAGEGRWEAGGLLGLLVEKEKVGRGKEDGPTGTKRREREGEGFWNFFFFKLFFKLCKLHSNIKPCFQIIMHKHLLFLTLLK